MGSSVGLGLGVTYLAAGMVHFASDHFRAERIAQAASGSFSESMLQREADRMDPAALHLARAHDLVNAQPTPAAPSAGETLPTPGDSRIPAGRAASALEGARELDCLTSAVYFEARGESPRGQAAVAQVVMNRVANPSFPKSVCAVVFQGAATHGCQFSFACDGSMRHGREAEAWDRARHVAQRALSGMVLAEVGRATHFHTTAVSPDWGPQMLRVAQVGLHIFYRCDPHAPTAPPRERAVFVSLPMSPASNIRLATAVLEKTADVTTAAANGLTAQASSPAPEARATKPSEPAFSLSKSSDSTVSAGSSDTAAS
ncbi:cell wall hydrolase [Phenylobacterium sp.]|jgi:spore germination cell wall hydrolase CwlJ-like protein|uniref:cell wall hydrolase n=1 Tax=Phenylobacterium sp. TaxID=1871053 RepID=UPI002F3E6D86